MEKRGALLWCNEQSVAIGSGVTVLGKVYCFSNGREKEFDDLNHDYTPVLIWKNATCEGTFSF